MNPQPESPAPPPIEILIVEDSATQALLLQRTLEKNGFRVTSAANGRLAWDELAHHRPTLVARNRTVSAPLPLGGIVERSMR